MKKSLGRRSVLKGALAGAAAVAAGASLGRRGTTPAHGSPALQKQLTVPNVASDGTVVSAPFLPEGSTTRTFADHLGIAFGVEGSYLQAAPEVKPLLPVHFNTLVGNFRMLGMAPERGQYSFGWTEFLFMWASGHNMRNHAHPLVWGSNGGYTYYTPDWVKAITRRDDAIAVLRDFVSTTVGHFPNVPIWTIANETAQPTVRDVWLEKIGPEYPYIAARAARDANPNASLMINDYGNHLPGSRADQNYSLASAMASEGILDAVGFQMHLVASRPPNPLEMRRTLEKFANLNGGRMKVRVTECDVSLAGVAGPQDYRWALEADVYRNALAALLDVGGDEFAIQGNSDALSWLLGLNPPNGGPDAEGTPFTASLALKPAYYALREVLARFAD